MADVAKNEKGKRFFDIMNEYNTAMANIASGFVRAGRCLKVIKQEQLWRLDKTAITFQQWTECELKISYSQAMRLIQIYEEVGTLLEKPELRHMDISKVTLLLPLLPNKTEEEKEEMLYMAKDLTLKDLKNNIKDLRGEAADDDCDHINTELWNKCLRCNKFFK